MSDKDKYLVFHGYTLGTTEAEEAWRQKCLMDEGHHFLPLPMAFVQRDVCYDSPIDGRPITNRQARIEDMKRANCVEYDPGMKQDHERRIRESDAALDKRVDQHVDREVALMPTRQREKLAAELKHGAVADIVRKGS